MGNTASDRKKDLMYNHSQHRDRRESLHSVPGTPPSTSRGKQKLVIQQSAEDSDNLSSIDEGQLMEFPSIAARGEGQQKATLHPGIQRPRATTYSHSGDASSNEPANLPTVFRYKGGGKQVYVAGDWNNFKTKIPLTKSQNDFVTILDLPEGTHEYRYFVDGQWVVDPDQKLKEAEGGAKVNVVEVSRSDFEVFDALAMDSEKGSLSSQFSASPPGSYSQEIPNKKPYESSTGPPILPPHLMQVGNIVRDLLHPDECEFSRQVILNRDIPVTYEPSLLPEPNHVMLNHLYALSIKDGVMVLSATHRYRKKYVTTLMYKPIS